MSGHETPTSLLGVCGGVPFVDVLPCSEFLTDGKTLYQARLCSGTGLFWPVGYACSRPQDAVRTAMDVAAVLHLQLNLTLPLGSG